MQLSSGGRSFPAFPYQPYGIQTEFMQHLYATLEKGGIGLFESPTGTGKTLSLICSALQWLADKQAAEAAAAAASARGQLAPASPAVDDGLPAWMRGHTAQKESRQRQDQERRRAERIRKAQLKAAAAKQAHAKCAQENADGNKKLDPPAGQGEDAEFLLDEWDSDAEASLGKRKPSRRRARIAAGFSSSDSDSGDSDGDPEEAAPPKRTQVFFCSRTHSQLSQFVSELHRTPFGETMSMVALASRKALCVNDAVVRLGSLARINEKCLDMQQAKSSKAPPGQDGTKAKSKRLSKCSFLNAPRKSQSNFQDAVLATPLDVEELAKLGRRKLICPYYSARRALPEADLVLLPYSALLLQDTRDSLGVQLEGSVVIVDEAHNLVDAVNGAHSALVSRCQLAGAHAQLSSYHECFRARLAPGNSKHIQTLLQLAQSLLDGLTSPAGMTVGSGPARSTAASQLCIQTVNEFLFSTGLDNVNMFRIGRYVKDSKVLFKVAGFADAARAKIAEVGLHKAGGDAAEAVLQGEGISALHALVSFIAALTNADADGRVVVDAGGGTLKFVLLNAAAHFCKVVSAAHAVVLASGTLSPIQSLEQQLFPDLPAASLHHFSCGHVMPRERLLALAVGQGPSGLALDLRHEARGSVKMMDEVGRLLVNICQAVPEGVVAFFPSFSNADQLYQHWQRSGLLAKLAAKKRVFQEPRAATEVEAMLQQYGDCIKGSTSSGTGGALLLCVVGGKMSEGINFGDGLGRCVVMVGLPYPNPADPELQERMRFIDAKHAKHTQHVALAKGTAASSTSASREYYEDLCMKAVNQCIGRVIRHRNDYAAIVLADITACPPPL
ncbi:hypothetical protein WJX72_005361 [[Myrmecia] bisecta]|uniref:Helicase ATP-binding domain-containing protein n=1 Tax=[Myrmecia] bisecta TaxID=41462 RepID=A0AAW1Q4B8_9CHLO